MKNTLKYLLISSVFMFAFIRCVVESPENVLTEVYGNIELTADCFNNNKIRILSASDFWISNRSEVAITPNGAFYAAFSGGNIIELTGSDLCGSDYQHVDAGFRREYKFSFKPVRENINIIINEASFPDSIQLYFINLARLIETPNNKLVPYDYDYHNFKQSFLSPKDTLYNFSLVDNEKYLLTITGRSFSGKSADFIKDTIIVNAQLSELVF